MRSALACLKWHLLKHKRLPALHLLAVLCCDLTVSQMSKQNSVPAPALHCDFSCDALCVQLSAPS